MNLVGPALVALGVSLLCAGGLLLQRYLDGSESDESNGSEYSFGFALNLKHVRKVLFRVDCQRAIEALPSVRLEQGEACAICLEPLEEARQLPCGHLFHQHCLLELTKSPSHSPSRRLRQEAHRAISCPLCRSVTVKIPVIGACREGAAFPKEDSDHACACLVVLTFPELEVVYEDLTMVHLTSPYVPEYLAFREVGFLVDAISSLGKSKPELLPQVILVDGNGMLHPRGFGIACHLGVLTDIPTVGVAKTLFHVDGIQRDSKHAEQIKNLLKTSGDSFPLLGFSGTTWGKALKSTQQACNPIYVSVGHKIGLETAVSLTHACCLYRIPEPIRQADIRSREYLRQHYSGELKNCSCRIQNSDNEAFTVAQNNQINQESLVDDTSQAFDDLKLS